MKKENGLTRQEVLSNRMKWIEYLEQPEREKGYGRLDTGHGRRCCLGHACHVLGIPAQETEDGIKYMDVRNTAPGVLQELLGLWGMQGGTIARPETGPLAALAVCALAVLNDATAATPQEIGAYLRSVVDGGEDTPFRPLSYYPE